jgi:hypothetical protein
MHDRGRAGESCRSPWRSRPIELVTTVSSSGSFNGAGRGPRARCRRGWRRPRPRRRRRRARGGPSTRVRRARPRRPSMTSSCQRGRLGIEGREKNSETSASNCSATPARAPLREPRGGRYRPLVGHEDRPRHVEGCPHEPLGEDRDLVDPRGHVVADQLEALLSVRRSPGSSSITAPMFIAEPATSSRTKALSRGSRTLGHRPVLPNPPSPRCAGGSSSTTRKWPTQRAR